MVQVGEETRAAAEAKKDLGNKAFKSKKYQAACDLYSEALELDPSNAVYWSNRAFAYLKTEAYGYAIIDASKAIDLDDGYTKAYYRRATANMALNKYKDSLRDFKKVIEKHPRDPNAKRKYKQCHQLVQRLLFSEAICTDDKKSMVDEINPENITVSENYTGPKLEANQVPDFDFLKQLLEFFKNEKNRLHRRYAYQIIIAANKLFRRYDSLVHVPIPEESTFTICGDIHGQFYDLLNIFEVNGMPCKKNPYLFNGDFVDRGSFSFECILTLFTFKLVYPDHFFMARGNHETVNMNRTYGFDGEVKNKGTDMMVELFHETFRTLPLAHVIENKVFCVHGGLFNEDGVTLDDIKKIDRFREPGDSGLMCDLLWADPMHANGRAMSKRGVGLHFGPDITQAFLDTNGLDYMVRSHEMKDSGYELMHSDKCITVFSAPNYCDQMGNQGALINITKHNLSPKFKTFSAVPHPDIKPMAYANMNGMFDF